MAAMIMSGRARLYYISKKFDLNQIKMCGAFVLKSSPVRSLWLDSRLGACG